MNGTSFTDSELMRLEVYVLYTLVPPVISVILIIYYSKTSLVPRNPSEIPAGLVITTTPTPL